MSGNLTWNSPLGKIWSFRFVEVIRIAYPSKWQKINPKTVANCGSGSILLVTDLRLWWPLFVTNIRGYIRHRHWYSSFRSQVSTHMTWKSLRIPWNLEGMKNPEGIERLLWSLREDNRRRKLKIKVWIEQVDYFQKLIIAFRLKLYIKLSKTSFRYAKMKIRLRAKKGKF